LADRTVYCKAALTASMPHTLLVSTGAVSCYPAPIVKIWFVDDKFSKFYSCSHKKRAKRSHLRVCGNSWTFTCSSKTVH